MRGLSTVMLAMAVVQPCAAATDLNTLQYSPDTTIAVSGTRLADQRVGDDDLGGTVGTVNLGGLAEELGVDAFHPAGGASSHFSLATPVTLDGVPMRPHDVIAFDGTSYSLAFDMSANGVPDHVDLVAVAMDGDQLYCVFDHHVVLDGTVFDDADVAAFDTSAGTFSRVFDGAAQGVSAATGVDGVECLSNGHWLFSFDRGATLGGVTFGAEDVAEFDPGGGSWSLAYDGSANAAGWSPSDLDALAATQQPPGDLQFSSATQAVAEGDGSVTVTVDRVNGTEGAVAVDYATSDATATAGSDYTAGSGTLNWADGDGSSKQFSVTINDDSISEGDETFDADLSSASGGASLGSPSTQTITINDNEVAVDYSAGNAGAPVFNRPDGTVGSCAAGSEVNFHVQAFTVPSSGSYDIESTQDYDGHLALYEAAFDPATPCGDLIGINDDGSGGVGTSEILNVSLSTNTDYFLVTSAFDTGQTGTFTNTITGPGQANLRNAGTLAFSSASQSVAEDGSLTVVVERTGGSYGAVEVDYDTSDGTAAAGSDYTAASGTLNWGDGDSSSKQFSVTINDDSISEGDETFDADLSSASGGATLGTPSTQTVTIADNDQQMVRWAQASICVDETTGSASATIERGNGTSGSVDVAFSVNAGSATTPDDFTVDTSSPITLSDGQATAPVAITISDDSDFEGGESFELQIDSVSGDAAIGMPQTVTIGIDDNEQPPGVLFRDGFEACPGL